MRSVALLHNPADLVDPFYAAQVGEVGERVDVRVAQFEADAAENLDRAFAAMKEGGAEGVVVLTEAFFAAEVQRIVRSRITTSCPRSTASVSSPAPAA